jgi:hypothetical protein
MIFSLKGFLGEDGEATLDSAELGEFDAEASELAIRLRAGGTDNLVGLDIPSEVAKMLQLGEKSPYLLRNHIGKLALTLTTVASATALTMALRAWRKSQSES